MSRPAPSHQMVLDQLSQHTNLPAVSVLAVRVAYYVAIWSFRSRSRRHLKAMTDAQLDDIGITRADALIEFQKASWRP